MVAAGTAGLLTAGCATAEGEPIAELGGSVPPSPPTPSPAAPAPAPLPLAGPPPARKVALPSTPITALPGRGRYLALTVDDGASSEVVGAYAKFAKDTGARFTFFVTGQFDAWTDNRAALRPLVESGQVQLGNHTWTHPDLTSLTEQGVADELGRCEKFLKNQYGVSGTPYFRPPFGYRNAAVDKVAADNGYVMPALWDGSLSDSGVVTEKFLVGAARQYFRPQKIVIGHANHAPVTHVYEDFVRIIRKRRLQLVTLNDYFAAP